MRRCDPTGGSSELVRDCVAGETCSVAGGEARCSCTPNASRGCAEGDVYSFDSCGNRLGLAIDCTGGATCVASGTTASCVTPPMSTMGSSMSCSPRASQECYLGDLYWADSCGIPNELAEDCPGQVTCNGIGGSPACRSSVANVASPYWSRSCPLVQDITLQTTLAADCRCFINRSPISGITDRCVGLNYVATATGIGTGPDVRSQPQSHINGGVVVGRELFAGVDWSSATRPKQGFVMAVNLDNGNRRIVSGGYNDPSLGFTETGSGPSLHRVLDVARGADGQLFALSVPAITAGLEIVRIDPMTGNRTRIWKGGDATFGQCASGDPGRLAVTYHDRVFGIAPDGGFYLAFRGAGTFSEGVGLVHVAASGMNCSFVTRSGSGALNTHAGNPIGNGYDVDRGFYAGLVQKDGQLFVLNDVFKALFRIDPATGNRVRLSSAATSWGLLGNGPENFGGIGQRWLAWDATRNVMWASGLESYRGLTAVDLTTGDRTEAYCRSTNAEAPWRNTCLGGVLEGGYQNLGGFWLDPMTNDPILVHENHSIVRVELLNGNSMKISF